MVGALIEAGATCYVPWRHEAEAERFAYSQHDQVKLFGSVDLTDESAVDRFFGEVPTSWASIHVAGGFAMAPVAKASKADLMQLLDMNLVSCFLCCSHAVNAIGRSGKGGRIVNVAARHAFEWRGGAGLVAYTASKAAVAALTVALSRKLPRKEFLSTRSPFDHGYAGEQAAMPKADYKAWPRWRKWQQPSWFSRPRKQGHARSCGSVHGHRDAVVRTGARNQLVALAYRILETRILGRDGWSLRDQTISCAFSVKFVRRSRSLKNNGFIKTAHHDIKSER